MLFRSIINDLKFDIVDNSPWDLDEKLVQYIRITVSFTVIGNTLPVYENVAFVVRQTGTPPPVPVTDKGEIKVIPPAIKDHTDNTSAQQRFIEKQIKIAGQQNKNRTQTASGQPNQIQRVPTTGQNLVLSNVLGR